MALPSAVTVGSIALVVAAGVGLAAVAAVSSQASDQPQDTSSEASAGVVSGSPVLGLRHGGRNDPARHSSRRHQAGDHKPRHASDVIPKILVVVYNNSGISGLAAGKAALLQGAGWSVAGADNWYGDIVANTVYYPPHHRDDAQKLAKTLHISRLMPAVTPMQFDRLTVIFTTA